MILNKVIVNNFKKINNLELSLANINILVGANGAGKSSVLQALHLACCTIRQANEVRPDKTSTIDIQNLDYLPTDEYKLLGHNCRWGNNTGTPSSNIHFEFSDKDNNISTVSCTLRSARNAGISITGIIPSLLNSYLRNKKQYFSAYIPGISGIPNKEERKSKKVILKSSSFGDSNIVLRNILLLLKEMDPNNIRKIEEWLTSLIGKINLIVEHNEDEDLFIKCLFYFTDERGFDTDPKPIELLGSGYLQLLQIFCYILLFKPKLLLIDEPDIHLHPNVQEKLVPILSRIAADEIPMRVVLTTHSPFIVRGATEECNIFWVNNGVAIEENRDVVSSILGWGIFDKKALILTEDSNLTLLRILLSQWPDIQSKISILPGNGYKNIPTPEQAEQFKHFLGSKYQIIVHRDRDSLTQNEVDHLKNAYQSKGVFLWVPNDSDIEAYFCIPEFLFNLFKDSNETESNNNLFCSLESTKLYIDQIIDEINRNKEAFNSHRNSHNTEIYKNTGGSPSHDSVWEILQSERILRGAKGKTLFNKLRNKLQAKPYQFELDTIKNFVLEDKYELASDLKRLLVDVMNHT